MKVGTATVTATTGPGETVTAGVFRNIKSFTVDIAKQMLFMTNDATQVLEFALGDTMTFTATISAGAWTITVSVS